MSFSPPTSLGKNGEGKGIVDDPEIMSGGSEEDVAEPVQDLDQDFDFIDEVLATYMQDM